MPQHRTEREKMLAGELYLIDDPELKAMRHSCYALLDRLNATSNAAKAERQAIFQKLFGSCGDNVNVKSTFRCDYGMNIHLGNDVFINVECVICDCAPVHIGDGTLIGPQVGIYAVTHPLDAEERAQGARMGRGHHHRQELLDRRARDDQPGRHARRQRRRGVGSRGHPLLPGQRSGGGRACAHHSGALSGSRGKEGADGAKTPTTRRSPAD